MTAERFEELLKKIDDAIGPPESESGEDRQRRLRAAARRRELRTFAARQRTAVMAGAAPAASTY
jgi:hypothetical protein